MAELDPHAPLDEGYWASLGQDQDPFGGPPPGQNQDPFAGQDDLPTGRSSYDPVWLKTRNGIEFIDVFIGDSPGSDDSHALVFLFEVPDVIGDARWNVGRCRSKTTSGGGWIAEGVEYATARELAERRGMATSVDAGRNADWRLGPASPGQVRLLGKLLLWDDGNDDDRVLTKGQASDLLNTHFGSNVLDPDFS